MRDHTPRTGAQRAKAEKLLQGDQLAQAQESLSLDIWISQPSKSGLGLTIAYEAGLWTSISLHLLLLRSFRAARRELEAHETPPRAEASGQVTDSCSLAVTICRFGATESAKEEGGWRTEEGRPSEGSRFRA